MQIALTLSMPRARQSDDFARALLARAARWLLLIVGGLLILAGFLIAPLPGPLGVPLTVVGLMLVLRNSFWARKQFIKVQRAHPKVIFPLRRLLRREPEVLQVAWQQALRIERIILPRRWRVAVQWRRSLRRKSRAV